MKYFCVENQELISVLDYNPSVPPSVVVVLVNDEKHSLLQNKTHYFDPKKMKIVKYTEQQLAEMKS